MVNGLVFRIMTWPWEALTRPWVLCLCFVLRCLFLCSYFFWPLWCLFFFDLRIQITPLESSNASWVWFPSPVPIETIELVYQSTHILCMACCSCHCSRCNNCSEQEGLSSSVRLSSGSRHQYPVKLLHLYISIYTYIFMACCSCHRCRCNNCSEHDASN